MTANDIADVTLDWCTHDDISHEVEQKQESSGDVVAPAVGRSTSAEQQFRQRGHQYSNEDVGACTRTSHDLLVTSTVVYGRS